MLSVAGAENKRQLKEIEDKILEVLSASTGNILEDESAISVITEAKRLGNDIAAKQRQGEATEAAIDEARVAYAPCGDYLSTLFFCISGETTISLRTCCDRRQRVHLLAVWLSQASATGALESTHNLYHDITAAAPADLAAIDPMYQYSLPWFTRLVLASLAQAAKPDSVPQRLEAIHSHFTASLYRNVCR